MSKLKSFRVNINGITKRISAKDYFELIKKPLDEEGYYTIFNSYKTASFLNCPLVVSLGDKSITLNKDNRISILKTFFEEDKGVFSFSVLPFDDNKQYTSGFFYSSEQDALTSAISWMSTNFSGSVIINKSLY